MGTEHRPLEKLGDCLLSAPKVGRRIWHWVVLALLVLIGLRLGEEGIEARLPYISHIDEPAISGAAGQILKTGNFHPTRFDYPSFPIYLAAASMTVGFLSSAGRLELQNIKDLGHFTFPYFSNPRVVRAAKHVFLACSYLGVVFTALLAWKLTHSQLAVVLVPLPFLGSFLFGTLSFAYLNPNPIGMTVVAACLLVLVERLHSDTWWDRSIVPGILTALASASKYNLVVMIVPAVIPIFFYSQRKIEKLLLLAMCTAVAFVVFVPYCLVDFRVFMDYLGDQVHHYSFGHGSATVERGWPHFSVIVATLVSDLGVFVAVTAVIGAIALIRSKPAASAIVFAFLISYVGLMCRQRVFFARNVLFIYPSVALCACVGTAAIVQFANVAVRNCIDSLRKGTGLAAATWGGAFVAALALAAMTWLFIPWGKLNPLLSPDEDSRKVAVRWFNEKLPDNATLLVPSNIYLDTSHIKSNVKIVEFNGREFSVEKYLTVLSQPNGYVLVPEFNFENEPDDVAELARRFNASFQSLERLESFGQWPVAVRYLAEVPGGSPRFAIARLMPSTR